MKRADDVNAPHTLFEVSWEVCNKVGGIHTVISTKASTVVGRYGDDYICLGPWLMSSDAGQPPFEETPGFEDFAETCRAMGVPVRVGRWLIPGRPRTILVEFSGLIGKKDEILAKLWEQHQVNSLFGNWDYIEPVLFGHACGMVIEKWFRESLAPFHGRGVAHFHEWLTASGMLYLRDKVPAIGTVFTTHATMLGRAVAATGQSPQDGLMGREPEEVAESVGVTAKHSLEGVSARTADAFTTVSDVTADEAEIFHHRRADPILPNGIDLDVIDELAGDHPREEVRATLENLVSKFVDEDMAGAAMFAISGRYEFHNKGIDLFLDALAKLNQRSGRKVAAFILVPAGQSGIKKALGERLKDGSAETQGPLGISTHNLFDEEQDPVHVHCRRLGLTNQPGSRVKVVQVPMYLGAGDDFLRLPYEAVLRAMDLSCFPSFYEPWGYTPEESLAVGVPTVTTDYAGFGRWVRSAGVGPESGVYVLSRVGVDYEEVTLGLEDILESFLGEEQDQDQLREICRATAQRTAWSDLVLNYYRAYEMALEAATKRVLTRTHARQLRRKIVRHKDVTGLAKGPRLNTFSVSATLPVELHGLETLAQNYWWSWDHEATTLFSEISPTRWDACQHNPVLFLREVFPEDLEAKVKDRGYVARLHRVLDRFDAYMAEVSKAPASADSELSWRNPAAYFCAEFAVHESLKIFSGGLGVLAGDHLKSASDLNLPLVAVGLFYRRGYMRQRLTPTGEQLSEPEENDPGLLAVEPVLSATGTPLEIELQLPSSNVLLRAWKVQVGRVPLYLLDSDVPSNRPEDREITASLYGGDHENRLRQEILLGRGGARLLAELGIEPAVYHINEGHAAFLSLERVRRLIKDEGLTFFEGREICRATTVFTTHTPVPAGHDRFPEDLMRRYFSDVSSWLGVPWERFYELGRAEGDDGSFNLTYLAMGFAQVVNGVSRLHGEVSRGLLHPYWNRLLESEVPVTHITNGVHLPTWTSPELSELLRGGDRVLRGVHFAQKAASLDVHELWEAKQKAKARMLTRVRSWLERSWRVRNERPIPIGRMLDGLDEHALYIGFARRFAPYKRAGLLFHDKERLTRILGDDERPVRVIIAGKAHPADKFGQDILRQVVEMTRRDEFLGKVFFVENYDVELARYLVQGVDLWLNTPTRPLEASGTSGMKVAANGGLNLSVKDGWWLEGATDGNGWSIGDGRVYQDQHLQDEMDAATLYSLLEEEIVPLYFSQQHGISRGWLAQMRRSLATLPPMFNTERMVSEYRDVAYEVLAGNRRLIADDHYKLARNLAERHHRIQRDFGNVRVQQAAVGDLRDLRIGDPVEVRVEVDLGQLAADDVVVELVLGHQRRADDLHNPIVVPLRPVGEPSGAVHTYEGAHTMERCGNFAYGIRVRPRQDGPLDFGLHNLVMWA